MSIRNLISQLFNQNRRPVRRPAAKQHLPAAAESMEARTLLSAIMSSPTYNGPTNPVGDVGQMNPLTDIPELDSLPGAPVSIYLDFDGHTETDPGWAGNNPNVVTPVFDIDNDETTFSDEELRRIEEIWYRVAEDFAPFNVNVTTVDPGTYNNFETILVSIGGDGAWFGAAGGVAFLNAFNNGASNTVYVFTDNLGPGNTKYIALATSHEAGHAFGLQHHSVFDANGNKTAEYDPGTADLGWIMGAPFNSTREIWNDGPSSPGANVLQDDLAVMTRAQNQTFTYRTDDHGGTTAAATVLDSSVADVSASGIIERNNDADFFEFDTDGGQISFSAQGLDLTQIYPGLTNTPGTNLDIVLTLYDSSGVVVATDDPTNSLNASLTASVAAGTYYIAVSGAGQYGDLGQYDLSGTIIPLAGAPVLISPTGTITDGIPTYTWTPTLNAARYELEVTNALNGAVVYNPTNLTVVTHTPNFALQEGTYNARVRAVQTNGTVSEYSNTLQFTVDVPAPTRPVIIRPSVNVTSETQPTFEWTANNASSYTLWVDKAESSNNLDDRERVIYRPNEDVKSYTHFKALGEGTYVVWVRAFNEIGEFSAWSEPHIFDIDIPTPARPTLVDLGGTITDVTPTIDWDDIQFAFRYDLWINDLSRGISQAVREENITGQSFFDIVDALPQGTYRAWVRAINGNDEAGPWSFPITFTIDQEPPSQPTVSGPATNAAGEVPTPTPRFTWSTALGAVRYEVWINDSNSRVIHDTNVTGLSYTIETPLPQGDYRFWVRGINEAGEGGEWSAVERFTIDVPTPSVPTIIRPVAGPSGVVEDPTPTFEWTTDIPGEFYDLWINDVTESIGQVVRVTDITELTYTIPDDQALSQHTYTAWVRAGNSEGEFSAWSDPFTFRIDVPNATTPVLIGPIGAVLTNFPTFTWRHSPGNTGYQILVRDLERREMIVLDVDTFEVDGSTNTAAYTSTVEFQPGTYRFWIRAFNNQGDPSGWSDDLSFVVAALTDDGQPNDSSSTELEVQLTSLTPEQNVQELQTETDVHESEVRVDETLTKDAADTVASNTTPVEQPKANSSDSSIEIVMARFADPSEDAALDISESEKNS